MKKIVLGLILVLGLSGGASAVKAGEVGNGQESDLAGPPGPPLPETVLESNEGQGEQGMAASAQGSEAGLEPTTGHGQGEGQPAAVDGEGQGHGESEGSVASAHGTSDHGESEGHEGGGHAPQPWYRNQDLWKLINMGVIVFLIMHLAGGGMRTGMRNRSSSIRNELFSARSALEAAEKSLDDVEFRLAKLREEIDEMRETARRLAEQEKERIFQEAETAAQGVAIGAKRQIEVQIRGSKRELREYVAGLMVDRVRSQLIQRVEQDGDAPFVDSLLRKVEVLR